MVLQYEIANDKDSRFLRPTRGGNVDVVNDFAWTLSPKSARVDTPYAHLVEYQQTTGQLMASIVYYSRIASNFQRDGFNPKDPTEVFNFKYIAEPTGFSYRFPYFATQKHSRSTDFSGESTESPFDKIHDLGKNILGFGSERGHGLFNTVLALGAKVAATAEIAKSVVDFYQPGKVSYELPQKWNNTRENSFALNFHLFNTGSLEDIENNRNLAHILAYQNSPSRRNFALVDPTVIYSLYIPDTVNFPACYMDSLNIKNVGNTRIIMTGGKPRIIPEAYEFSMTFSSLMMPSRNIMGKLDKGEIVQAINSVAGLEELKAAHEAVNRRAQENGGIVSDEDNNWL